MLSLNSSYSRRFLERNMRNIKGKATKNIPITQSVTPSTNRQVQPASSSFLAIFKANPVSFGKTLRTVGFAQGLRCWRHWPFSLPFPVSKPYGFHETQIHTLHRADGSNSLGPLSLISYESKSDWWNSSIPSSLFPRFMFCLSGILKIFELYSLSRKRVFFS